MGPMNRSKNKLNSKKKLAFKANAKHTLRVCLDRTYFAETEN